MKNLLKAQFFLFILLLVLWNIFTPVSEGADEVGHYCHADYIAHRNSLPNLNRIDGCFLWHPPIYYLTLSPIIKLFNVPEFTTNDFRKNPNFSNLKHGEYSQYVHNKDELVFKWDKKILMVHVLRGVSSILALGTFVLTWKVASVVFKGSLMANLSLLMFFNPMFLHISTTLTNVTPINFIATLIIALDLVKPRRKTINYLLEGIILGIGFITKITILSLFLAKAYTFIKNNKLFSKEFHLRALLLTVGFFSACGWYLYRSYTLYGDVLERNVIARIPGEYNHGSFVSDIGIINYVNSLFTTLFKTFWSGYGAITVNFPQPINLVLLVFIMILAYVLVKNRKSISKPLETSAIYFGSILMTLILMNTQLRAMHAKDLFLAYLPIALLFAFALSKTNITLKNKPGIKFQLIAFVLALYFFAQSEIVETAKATLQTLGLRGFYDSSTTGLSAGAIVILLVKAVIVIVVYKLILSLLSKIVISKNTVKVFTYCSFVINLVVLSITSYLFYFRFL